jgi:N-acetylglucosaminyl-diphospho-decaprenol L-rhamnosyltransferase
MSDVAVVIGNYEGEHLLPDCLHSLEQQTVEPTEVVVVDASSTDGSAGVAGRLGARVLGARNNGLGYLYNRGVETVEAPFVLLANNDVSFDPRCVELLRDALLADRQCFSADPRQMDWDGSRLVHARTELRRGPLFHRVLPGFDLDLTVPADRPLHTLTANGGAMLVRRDRFLELGGFDETFFMDFEDIDLCWRAWLRGWASVYVPDAWLRHRVGAVTTARILPKRIASSHHNLLRFALKCFPVRAAATVVAGELLRLPRHPRAIAPALAQIARELPEIADQRRKLAPSAEFFDWALAGMPS